MLSWSPAKDKDGPSWRWWVRLGGPDSQLPAHQPFRPAERPAFAASTRGDMGGDPGEPPEDHRAQASPG